MITRALQYLPGLYGRFSLSGIFSILNVIDFTTFLQQEKIRKRISAALFLYLKGAYENVANYAVSNFLQAIEISGRMLRWLSDYISCISFFMQAEDDPTAEHYTYCGVPQGAPCCSM